MLGLGLVVSSVVLLLGGTLYGMRAYGAMVRTTERKLYELQIASILIDTLKPPEKSDSTTEYRQFEQKLQAARLQLDLFRGANAETVEMGILPDDGEHEAGLLRELDLDLAKLLDNLHKPETRSTGTSSPWLREDLAPVYDATRQHAEHLRLALYQDVQNRMNESNRSIRQSMYVVYLATAWAFALTLTLLYYFRVWMFAPIRQLQAGVARVHSGDFNHPISLASGDELQELADEFNAMTARLGAIYADLARQVNERSRQLVRSERMVSVGFLAAGVAHEINNPLASILFCSEAMERRLQEVLAALTPGPEHTPADSEVLTRYLKMIQQEALRCKDITQKLLDFSRTGERKRESTDIGGLIRGVLEVARHLPNCRGKNISFEPTGYIVAPVNAQDLKSVILNLVVNALDSMEEGGRLAIGLGIGDGNAVISFTDSGCGMTPDVLQNIFEPFFTKSRTGKGTGLGLFISQQIIDQHGGTIEAASAGPGQGSTFTVRVPLSEADAQERTPGEKPEPAIMPFPGVRVAA
jgi:signal transduction histidine kinase